MKKASYKRGNVAQKINRSARGGLEDKFHAYLNIHAHALFSSLGRLVRNPFTSMMTVTVLSIAIALASSFYLLVANIQQLTESLQDSNKISLFLKESVTDQQGKLLAAKIKQNPDVQQIKVITKSEALEEFRQYSGFGDALNTLERNPLPTVLQIVPVNTLTESEQLNQLLHSLNTINDVDFAQLDMQWVKRLQSMMELARRGVTLLAIILGLAVLFITGNTIRLELHNRREEVVIAKLVGATNSFIQRPFLYSGFWLGLASGFLAWLVVTIMMLILQDPVEELSNLYGGIFNFLYLGFVETLLLFVISAALGILGSWVVLRYQLKQLRPE